MSTAIEFAPGDLSECILPSQYDDLMRRGARKLDGEYRLLFAILEAGIRSYLANRACSNQIQRENFEEVCRWLEPAPDEHRNLFSFQTVCDFLEIDRGRLLKELKSVHAREFSPPRRRFCVTRGGQLQVLHKSRKPARVRTYIGTKPPLPNSRS